MINKILLTLFIIIYTIPSYGNDLIGEYYQWKTISPGAYPEHIQVDPSDVNIVWFTLTYIRGLGKFNFKTNEMKEYKTDGKLKYLPDEMAIDKNGLIWIGEQKSGTLGKFDPKTEQFTHYCVPYTNASPNVPMVDHEGNIWFTDHNNDKIVKFDPNNEKFQVFRTPNPRSWVVCLREDPKHRIWYTCTVSNRIGYITPDRKKAVEYTIPQYKGGPAWLDIDSKNNIWVTEWFSNKIAKFDPDNEQFTEYQFEDTFSESRSIVVDKNDDTIFFTSERLNSIIMFNPKKDDSFIAFPIPTYNPGLDDGLTIDKNGIVWFTQINANKIGRFRVITRKDIKSKDTRQKQVYMQSEKYKVKKKTIQSSPNHYDLNFVDKKICLIYGLERIKRDWRSFLLI